MSTRIQVRFVLIALLAVLPAPHLNGMQPVHDKKPLVVVVYADWCPYCQKLKPALALINERYKGKVNFVRLDVTSQASTVASRLEAARLGLSSFFDQYQGSTSLVMIQDPAGHEVFRAVHDYNFQHYATVLDQQLSARQK